MIKLDSIWLSFLLIVGNPTEGRHQLDNLIHSEYFGDDELGMFRFREGRFFIGQIIDTYWCGSGNVSRGMDELGPNYLVDSCCRTHDLCPIYIEPDRTEYGVRNEGSYTHVSCVCDHEFYTCLNRVNTVSANLVIDLYALTEPKCLVFRRLVYKCVAYPKLCEGYREQESNLCLRNECLRYNVEDLYQLEDSEFKKHKQHLPNKQLRQNDPPQ